MVGALKRFLQVPPSAVVPENYRTYFAFHVGAISAFFIHLAILPIFLWLGAWEMLWLNIGSEVLYAFAWLANRRGHHAAMITLCALELCVHQTACVYYLGWGAGFQFYLFVLPAFVFFLPKGREITQVAIMVVSTTVFLELMSWSRHMTPVHQIDPAALSTLASLNVTAVFALLGFFGFNFRSAAEAAEDRLAQSERNQADKRLLLLRAAIGAAKDVIVITDERGDIEFANEAFGRDTGHAPAEVVGKSIAILRSDTHPRGFFRDMWRALATGEPWSGRIVNRRKDGTTYVDDTRITPVSDDEGRQHYIAIKHDVTDQVAAAEKLRLTEEELRHAKKMEAIGTLAGGVAHDFNNLLTAILGSAHLLLLDLPPNSPCVDDVHEIRKASERAASLTRQLLAYSRKQVLSVQALDLNQVLQGVEQLLRRSISEQVRFVLELAPDVHPIQADEAQLGQVLLNLAVNANDAMPTGGTLTVRTRNVTLAEATRVGQLTVPAGTYAVVSVTDTGEGIPDDVLPQIFEPFFSTKGPGKGTGLGLSTVFGIVAQSNGFVTVESAVGQGTTFTVFMPRAAPAPAVGEAPEVVEVAHATETILVVDDDPAVRQVTVRMLNAAGYAVLEARNGEEALDLLRNLPAHVDLILTDVMMPGIDGATLISHVRRDHPDVRAVFVSGYPSDVIRARGEFVVGENFLSKPFAPGTLTEAVRRALRSAPPTS